MNEIKKLIQELCPDGVEYRRLGEVCVLQRGKVISKDYIRDNQGIYPVYSSQTANNGILGYIDSFMFDGDYLTWTTDGAYAGTVFRRKGKFNITNVCGLINSKADFVNQDFLYFWLSFTAKNYVSEGMGNPKLMSNVLSTIPIPLPPITIQEKIVEILDKFTSLEAELEAELEARRKQYEYYREKLLTFSPDDENVRWATLGEIGEVCMCKRIMKYQTASTGDIPFYKIGTFGGKADAYIERSLYEEYKSKYSFPKKGDILISAAGTIGRAVIYDGKDAYFQDSNIVWIDNDEKVLLNSFLYYLYQIIDWKTDGGTIKRLYNNNLKAAFIPVPPLSEQRRIVEILDRFEALTNDLQAGLPAEIAARRQQYEYYREKLLTFKRKTV